MATWTITVERVELRGVRLEVMYSAESPGEEKIWGRLELLPDEDGNYPNEAAMKGQVRAALGATLSHRSEQQTRTTKSATIKALEGTNFQEAL